MMQWLLTGSSLSFLFLCVLYLVRGTWSACPDNPNRSVKYEAVKEENYDKNYSSITSDGKRPLGYDKAVWYYNQGLTPCINITGASSRRLEVMFETFPPSRLCVRIQSALMYCSDPGTGRLYLCTQTLADTLYLEFTCDSQCGENDVQFWYRLVLGERAEMDTEDHWCDTRDREAYPGSLLQLPSGFPMNSQTTKPNNQGYKASPSAFMLLFAASYVYSVMN